MPKPLVKELKALVHENHYLDLSEELRSVIRKHARTYLNPHEGLRNELTKELKNKNQELRKAEVMSELKKLLEGEE